MKTETNTNPEPNTTPPATWWTPQGFVIQDTPAAFLAVLEIPNGIWGEILKAAGYKHFADSGGEFSELQVGIYEHQSRDHFYVEVSNWDHGLSEFFVSKHDEDIFFVTWYPEFLRSLAQIEQAERIETLTKSLIAFVRHGHGTDTIDEDGDRSYDDNARWREARLARKAGKAVASTRDP